MFDFATQVIFECEPEFSGLAREITDEIIQEKKEQYEEIAEDFLDTVFDVESKLKRVEWEKAVASKYAHIFNPEEVRKKLGYQY